MKVKKMNALTKAKIENSLLKIQNYLGEKGKGLVDELRAIFDEMEASDVEISDDELKSKIQEILKASELFATAEQVAEVANKLAKFTAESKGVVNGISKEQKKAIANALMQPAKSFAEVKDRVMRVAVENDITGLTFGEIISYAIADKFGSQNEFFDKLRQVPFTKFFYTEADMATASAIAKQWDKESEQAKAVQALEVEGKTIATKYIHKRQRVAEEDLDAVREEGNEAELLRFVTEELYRVVIATIVKTILVGDSTNVGADRITTFESVGTKTKSDVFTNVVNPEEAGSIELGDVVRMVRSLHNPEGKEVALFIDPAVLDAISRFKYAEGGSTDYRSIDDLKTKLGVDYIYKYDLHTLGSAQLHAVAIIPDEYWVKTRREKEVSWPQYDRNEVNWMYERNTGGGVHGIGSTAVLRSAQ
ncbi:MAG: hypothetical protein U0L66_08355 [Acutalibacteraceae bacterium]|nr:hypothetical protein [Acutalibacteraceae bacterium]